MVDETRASEAQKNNEMIVEKHDQITRLQDDTESLKRVCWVIGWVSAADSYIQSSRCYTV